jgi:hypothetical protein
LVGRISGSIYDITLFYTYGLKFHLLSGEIILVNKEYIGDNIIIHPFKPAKTEKEKKFNSIINSIHQIVEYTYV